MSTQNLQRIKELKHNASGLDAFDEKMATLRSDSRNDKLGAGFNRDDRFRAFSVHVGFDSWCGQYGSSSCGRVLHLDDKLVGPAFIKALNQHRALLFSATAEILRREATELTEKAQAEVAALQKMLDELSAPLAQLDIDQ